MILNLLAWILFGLIVGFIARALLPGRDTMGLVGTVIVGIIGSVVGGLIGSVLVGGPEDRFQPAGFLGAVIGSILVLLLLRALRPRTIY